MKLVVVSILLSRCTRETSHDCFCAITRKVNFNTTFTLYAQKRRKTVSVLSHAKLVSRSIIRHKPRQQQHHNGRFGWQLSSSSNNHDGKIYMRCYMQPRRWRIGRLGRWQSSSSNNHAEKTYTHCYMRPGRRRIGFSARHGEIVFSR